MFNKKIVIFNYYYVFLYQDRKIKINFLVDIKGRKYLFFADWSVIYYELFFYL